MGVAIPMSFFIAFIFFFFIFFFIIIFGAGVALIEGAMAPGVAIMASSAKANPLKLKINPAKATAKKRFIKTSPFILFLLLPSREKVGMRGRDFQPIPLMPTFH